MGSTSIRVEPEITMPELYFGANPLPPWESICARVAEAHAVL